MNTIKKIHFDFQPKMLFLFSCCSFCWNDVKNHRFKCACVSWIVPPDVALFHIIWNINTNIRLYKIWLFPKTFLSVAYLEQTKKNIDPFHRHQIGNIMYSMTQGKVYDWFAFLQIQRQNIKPKKRANCSFILPMKCSLLSSIAADKLYSSMRLSEMSKTK